MRDDDLRRMFDRLTFYDEPPMQSRAADDAQRGRHRLRRKRAGMLGGALGGTAAVATAVVVMFSGGPVQVGPSLDVADGGDRDTGLENVTIDGGGHPFAASYETLFSLAAEHLDPDGEHLDPRTPLPSRPADQSTMWQVSRKLSWTNPGEPGMGMVHVIVTLPGYAAQAGAAGDIATQIACDEATGCTEREASSGGTVLVAEPDPSRNLLFGVMYERSDGSFAAVAVHDLFGNNSVEPVSAVDITVEQAIEFVTDPKLSVDADEAAAELVRVPDEPVEAGAPKEPEEPADFSNRKIVAAPASKEMTDDEARAALDACVAGVPAWSDFTPVFGMWIDQDERRVAWLIGERGDDRMLCADGDVSIFAGADAKGKIDGDVAVDSVYTDHFGVYGHSVDTVTVQLDGQPEQMAVMHEGYWYLPVDASQERRIAIRGYDADAQLVHDSTAGSEAMAEPDR